MLSCLWLQEIGVQVEEPFGILALEVSRGMAGTVFTPAQAHHAQALTPKHQAFGGARQLAKCLVDGLLVTMCLVVLYCMQ